MAQVHRVAEVQVLVNVPAKLLCSHERENCPYLRSVFRSLAVPIIRVYGVLKPCLEYRKRRVAAPS